MKPITLKIKGINSFIEEQIIDFEKLTDRGIFGIFGPTGSGKSTILDAITIALYDEIARNTNEYINKEVTTASVYFEFEITTSVEPRIYAIERTYKKNDADTKKSVTAKIYDKTDIKNIIIIADKSRAVNAAVIDIIGLTYDDFTRSVVLPQGKFSEFLTLSGKDRRDMLERIFHLEKYGKELGDRINSAANNGKYNLKEVEAKLSVYGDITEAMVTEYKLQLEKLNSEGEILAVEAEKHKKSLIEAEELFSLNSELSIFKNKKIELMGIESQINQFISILDTAKKADEVMPFLISFNETSEKIVNLKNELKKADDAYSKIIDEYNNLKLRYDTALNEKNEKYSLYLKKEENLKQAVIIEKEINITDIERKKLLEEYKDLKNKSSIENNNFNKFLENKKLLFEKSEILRNRKSKIEIDSEYKEKIIKASNIEEKYIDKCKSLNEINSKIDNSKNKLKLKKEECEKTVKELENYTELNLKLKNEFKCHIEKHHVSNEDIVKLADNISTLKNKHSEITKLSARKNIITSEMAKTTDKIYELEDRCLSSKNQINEFEQSLTEIENQISAIEKSNMAAILSSLLNDNSPCPVCGSLNHPNPAENIVGELSQTLLNDKNKIKKQKLKLEENYNKTTIELEKMKTEYSIIENENIEIEKNLNGETIEISKYVLEKSNSDFNEFNEKLNMFEDDKKQFEINIINNEKLLNSITVKMAEIDEAVRNAENQNNENLEDHTKIYKETENLKNDIEKLIEELKPSKSFGDEIKNITMFEREKEKIEKEELKIKKQIEDVDNSKDISNKLINEIQTKMSVIEMQGKEKRVVIDEKQTKVNELSEGNNTSEYLNKVSSEIKRIVNEEQKLKSMLENDEAKKMESKDVKTKIDEQLKTFLDTLIVQEKKLNNYNNKNGFGTIDEVKNSFVEKKRQFEIQFEIDDYNNKITDTLNNIKRLELKTDLKTISREKIDELSKCSEDTILRKEEVLKSSAVKLSEINSMKEKLLSVNILKKEQSKLEHECSILIDLSDLMKGNRFVEYVAAGQLEYITAEASKRLKKITKGRYALELSGSEFIMRDDFNGGSRRRPNTLSGGEVFLTSFALALALSSKIQMKNNAPLQFFFLDEGFGTLDSRLLDVVMTSLESLHSEQLSVGIITHVEELKERIPIKLMVAPAVQGICGTKTKLEYI